MKINLNISYLNRKYKSLQMFSLIWNISHNFIVDISSKVTQLKLCPILVTKIILILSQSNVSFTYTLLVSTLDDSVVLLKLNSLTVIYDTQSIYYLPATKLLK